MTPRRRVDWARHFPFQDDTLSPEIRVGDGGSCQERFGVGMSGLLIEYVCGGQFHNPSQIHDGNPAAQVLNYREVVGDK